MALRAQRAPLQVLTIILFKEAGGTGQLTSVPEDIQALLGRKIFVDKIEPPAFCLVRALR